MNALWVIIPATLLCQHRCPYGVLPFQTNPSHCALLKHAFQQSENVNAASRYPSQRLSPFVGGNHVTKTTDLQIHELYHNFSIAESYYFRLKGRTVTTITTQSITHWFIQYCMCIREKLISIRQAHVYRLNHTIDVHAACQAVVCGTMCL